jgi:hypothetical protein
MAVFWVVAPCSLVEVYRHFRGACCLHHQGDDRPDDGGIALIIETARTSETSVSFYQTSRRNNLEDSHLHTPRRKDLRSQSSNVGTKLM